MDLRQLQYFLTVVESGSFGKAAKTLHISQPALSKAVRHLETSLGVQLLDRLPRGISPTLYGATLAAHASLIGAEINRATSAILALQRGTSGRVVVGAGSSMRIELLPQATVRLRARHPDADIKMIGELYDDLLPDLQKGDLDVVLSMLPAHHVDADIQQISLYVDQTHPTVRKNHPLAKKRRPTAEACLEYGWILPSSDNLGRRHLDAYFLARDLPAPEAAIESNSTIFAVNVIRKSDLIGWHPTQVIGNVEETGLVALPIDDITLTRTVGISFRRNSVLSPAALALIDELKQVSSEMIKANRVMPLPAR